jgi:hypothetical protein
LAEASDHIIVTADYFEVHFLKHTDGIIQVHPVIAKARALFLITSVESQGPSFAISGNIDANGLWAKTRRICGHASGK